MKKLGFILLAIVMGSSTLLTACSRTGRDDANVAEMENGQVVEVEGPQDQYGWFPHLRLTFDGDVLTEVYFDYIDDEAAKKSQDEEYNSTMQEKTGMSAKEAMETLRANLIETQDPAAVDIVAGATQTSTEFIELARQGFEKYSDGKTSANNYGEDNSGLGVTDPAKEQSSGGQEGGSEGSQDTTGNIGQGTQAGATGDTGSTTGEGGSGSSGQGEATSPYTTGGDGNPNSQSGGNSNQSSASGGGEGGGGNTK